MRKKAQSEIMGLVIIVIIITVALLVYLSYSANTTSSTSNSLYKEYAYNDLAVSYLDTYLSTHIPGCGDITLEQLIQNCGTTNEVICLGTPSCSLVESLSDTLISQTLDVWNIPYGFQIYTQLSDEEAFMTRTLEDTSCLPGTVGRGSPGVFLISYFPYSGTARLELGFCMP